MDEEEKVQERVRIEKMFQKPFCKQAMIELVISDMVCNLSEEFGKRSDALDAIGRDVMHRTILKKKEEYKKCGA